MTDAQLTRAFDRVQAHAFLGKTAAFFGSILCSLDFSWQEFDCQTACTDGTILHWNPVWFQAIPQEARVTVLMHELWHVGLLHGPRGIGKDHKLWNEACDHYINLQLDAELDDNNNKVYSFVGIEYGLKDPRFIGMTEDEIYDVLLSEQASNSQQKQAGTGSFGIDEQDMKVTNQEKQAGVVNTVVKAMQQQKIAGGSNAIKGILNGHLEKVIAQFLKSVVPWQSLLNQFFTELDETRTSWRRPNRRYSDIYMPSRIKDMGKLTHIAYFEDVSGSITQKEMVRFNSEVAHVKRTYNPEKMTLIQFSETIVHEEIITEEDEFGDFTAYGRNGTCLIEVREWIIKNQPTAAIIFSDLEVRPMRPLPFDIPIIWVCLGNSRATVPFGTLVHIKREDL